jgi:hypothetical protein
MLSVEKHIGISCSHCWSEFIVCWASNFPLIQHFYAHALKCIHTFWVIYLLIMEIHSVSTIWKFVLQNVKKMILLKWLRCRNRLILGDFIFWKYVSMFSMMMVTLSLFGSRGNFFCFDVKCFVMLMNSFRYLTCLTRQLWKLVLVILLV